MGEIEEAKKKAADKKIAEEKKAAAEKKAADDKKASEEDDAKKKKKDDDPPDPVPYDRFKEVNDENRTMAARLKVMEEEEDERKAEDAKEQGKFEELYEEEKGKREASEQDLLKRDVALEKGLPADFVKRLQGKDREELEKDADSLLELIEEAKSGKKGIKDGSSKKSDTDKLEIDDMTPEEIREKAGELLSQ